MVIKKTLSIELVKKMYLFIQNNKLNIILELL